MTAEVEVGVEQSHGDPPESDELRTSCPAALTAG
jgi:hypothetical protein